MNESIPAVDEYEDEIKSQEESHDVYKSSIAQSKLSNDYEKKSDNEI